MNYNIYKHYHLLSQHILSNFIKHNNIIIGGYNYDNITDVLTFIKNDIKDIPIYNTQKFCILLYGLPASGKSFGFINGINLINKNYNLNLNSSHFLIINLDDIIMQTDEFKYEKKINKIVSENIYFKIRKKCEWIFELLIKLCLTFNINFSIEITGLRFDSWWINKLTDFKNLNYNLICIYSYIDDLSILKKRNIKRSKKTGRIINVDIFTNENKIIVENNFNNYILHNNIFNIIFKYNSENQNIENNILIYNINK